MVNHTVTARATASIIVTALSKAMPTMKQMVSSALKGLRSKVTGFDKKTY